MDTQDTADELQPETGAENQVAALDEDAPVLVGDFDSYDEVREKFDLRAGDLAPVNGGLARYCADGTFTVVVQDLSDYFAPPADHTERFGRSLADIERVVLNASFESGPLLGTLRDTVIGMFKAKPKAWTEMSQLEMRDLGKQVEQQCAQLIRKVARVIAEGEEISVVGKLESFNCKGGFDLKISAPGDEDAVVELFKMVGHDVVIVSADSKRFLDGVDPAEEIPDEPPLPFSDADPAMSEDRDPPEDDSDLNPDDDEESEEENEDPPVDEADVADAVAAGAIEGAAAVAREGGDADQAVAGAIGGAAAAAEATLEDKPSGVVAEKLPEADTFTEAPEEELAAQAGRQPAADKAKADYVGVKEPAEAVPGESWLNTGDDRIRWKHPNGKFYLSKPTEDALEEWRAGQKPAANAEDRNNPADADDFPADPQ